MAHVGVECRKQRRALLNDAYASVGASVNAPFVSFGKAEPALQVEVVRRESAVTPHEQAGREAFHDTRHVVQDAR